MDYETESYIFPDQETLEAAARGELEDEMPGSQAEAEDLLDYGTGYWDDGGEYDEEDSNNFANAVGDAATRIQHDIGRELTSAEFERLAQDTYNRGELPDLDERAEELKSRTDSREGRQAVMAETYDEAEAVRLAEGDPAAMSIAEDYPDSLGD